MTSNNHSRRVVITGMGVITPLACELESFWKALLAGRSGIGPITQFDASRLPCRIAGEVTEFDPEDYMAPKEARRMSRVSQMGIAASMAAVTDAGLPAPLPNPEEVGVYVGTAVGGLDRLDEGIQNFRSNGVGRVNPFSAPSVLPNMPAFHITHQFGALGPNTTITTSCASGTQVIGEAVNAIRAGRASVVIAGGTEAVITDFTIAAFSAMRALPTGFNDDPQHASRPFDALREGFILSEGAGFLVLEELEHACSRGAPHMYAEITGYASSSDAFHMAAPDPTAGGAIRTMKWALQAAEVEPSRVDYINAHGTGTPANDSVETLAIKQLFGEHAYDLPISSTKSMLGHALGASGAIEAVACALTIGRGMIHPTMNYEHPDPECDLDYVPLEPRPADVRIVLSNSFGLGGQNACLVLERLEDGCSSH
jgi:3-oxoacyl-[acyl-carrier-protein] synthase II